MNVCSSFSNIPRCSLKQPNGRLSAVTCSGSPPTDTVWWLTAVHGVCTAVPSKEWNVGACCSPSYLGCHTHCTLYDSERGNKGHWPFFIWLPVLKCQLKSTSKVNYWLWIPAFYVKPDCTALSSLPFNPAAAGTQCLTKSKQRMCRTVKVLHLYCFSLKGGGPAGSLPQWSSPSLLPSKLAKENPLIPAEAPRESYPSTQRHVSNKVAFQGWSCHVFTVFVSVSVSSHSLHPHCSLWSWVSCIIVLF